MGVYKSAFRCQVIRRHLDFQKISNMWSIAKILTSVFLARGKKTRRDFAVFPDSHLELAKIEKKMVQSDQKSKKDENPQKKSP